MHKGADFAALLAAVEVAARASKKGDPFVAMPQRVVGTRWMTGRRTVT